MSNRWWLELESGSAPGLGPGSERRGAVVVLWEFQGSWQPLLHSVLFFDAFWGFHPHLTIHPLNRLALRLVNLPPIHRRRRLERHLLLESRLPSRLQSHLESHLENPHDHSGHRSGHQLAVRLLVCSVARSVATGVVQLAPSFVQTSCLSAHDASCSKPEV